MALKIKEREANITKVESLKSATINGNLDVTQYRNKPIDSFLKVEETQALNDLTFEAVIGISVVAIVFIITCSSFVIYWIRKKRQPGSKNAGNCKDGSEY